MKYETRYCAFVDILGFSGLIQQLKSDAISFERLHDLLKVVHARPTEYQADPFASSDLRAQSISDAVCLSTACSEVGLSHLIYSLDQLTGRLLEVGYFVRGAIVKGRLFHDEEVVFGEALVSAYKLETEVARYPRIMIERDVAMDIQKYYSSHSHQTTWSLLEFQFFFCLMQGSDGPYFLNTLRDFEFKFDDAKDENQLERSNHIDKCNRIAEKIQTRFSKSVDTPRHFEKVQWFARYWNNYIAKRNDKLRKISGPGLGPDPSFEPLWLFLRDSGDQKLVSS